MSNKVTTEGAHIRKQEPPTTDHRAQWTRSGFLGMASCLTLILPGCAAPSHHWPAEVDTRLRALIGPYGRDIALTLVGFGKTLCGINESTPFPVASLSKLFILLAIVLGADDLHSLREKRFRLSDPRAIVKSDIYPHVRPGVLLSVDSLLSAMIVHSDNFAANALLSFFGKRRINEQTRAVGITEVEFHDYFTDEPAPNDVTVTATARAIARALEIIRYGTTAIPLSEKHAFMMYLLVRQTDKSLLPQGIPRGVPVGNKTGQVHRVLTEGAVVNPYGEQSIVCVTLMRNVLDEGNAFGLSREIGLLITELLLPSLI